MIVLKISDKDAQQLAIVEKIDTLSLAKKVITEPQRVNPLMIAYDKEYEGFQQIESGLVELEELVRQWYECRCDKYELTEE